MSEDCIIERLAEPLEDKINKIVENAAISPWKHRFLFPELDKSLIYSVIVHYFLIAKNGKKYTTSSYASNIIDEEKQKQRTYAQLEELKCHKACNTKKFLKHFIQSQFKKRIKLFGYRGSFKFVDIKDMK